MIIRGRAERFIAPGVPEVRSENLAAKFVESLMGNTGRAEKGINPGILDQANAGFEAASPVQTGEGRIVARPMVQPFDAFFLGPTVIEQPGGHGEADELIPTVRFPDDFDVGAIGLSAVIQ